MTSWGQSPYDFIPISFLVCCYSWVYLLVTDCPLSFHHSQFSHVHASSSSCSPVIQSLPLQLYFSFMTTHPTSSCDITPLILQKILNISSTRILLSYSIGPTIQQYIISHFFLEKTRDSFTTAFSHVAWNDAFAVVLKSDHSPPASSYIIIGTLG